MRKLAVVVAMACFFRERPGGKPASFWFNYGESFMNGGLGTPLAFGGSSNDVKLTDGYRFSFRFNFNVGDHYGAEVGYAFNHTNLNFSPAAAASLEGVPTSQGTPLELGMHMHQGTFNALYYPFTADKSRVRPFVTRRASNCDNFVPPGGQSYSGSTKFGLNFGGGVKVHIKGIWAARLWTRASI